MKALVAIVTLALLVNVQGVFAAGLIYGTKQMEGNKLKINLKWENPSDAKGIVLSYFYLENGKTLNVGYETKAGAPQTISFDCDLSGALPPIRILTRNIADKTGLPFSDIANSEAKEYIWHLHDAGIVNGSGGKFYPESTISRAEFIALIVRSLKLTGNPENTKGFKDIDNHWAKRDMLLGVKYGFLSGFDDKTLRPNNKISVAEVCTIISKAFRFNTNKNGTYSNVKTGQWFTPYVLKMFTAGILNVNDGIYKNFNEKAYISRANSAMMISRAISTY
jgi:hypothetical protein